MLLSCGAKTGDRRDGADSRGTIEKEDYQRIPVPVRLAADDREDIRMEHRIEMHSLLKASRLCILPNTTHFVFEKKSEIVKRILVAFLKQDAGRDEIPPMNGFVTQCGRRKTIIHGRRPY
jgi:pimeloyl-ACP methyl ester carboxylesterase